LDANSVPDVVAIGERAIDDILASEGKAGRHVLRKVIRFSDILVLQYSIRYDQ